MAGGREGSCGLSVFYNNGRAPLRGTEILKCIFIQISYSSCILENGGEMSPILLLRNHKVQAMLTSGPALFSLRQKTGSENSLVLEGYHVLLL